MRLQALHDIAATTCGKRVSAHFGGYFLILRAMGWGCSLGRAPEIIHAVQSREASTASKIMGKKMVAG